MKIKPMKPFPVMSKRKIGKLAHDQLMRDTKEILCRIISPCGTKEMQLYAKKGGTYGRRIVKAK